MNMIAQVHTKAIHYMLIFTDAYFKINDTNDFKIICTVFCINAELIGR